MKILHTLALAVTGCMVAAPLSFAQTTSSGPASTYQAPAKQHADAAASDGSSQYPNGAHKQKTQGLPPGLSPNSNVPWNNHSGSGSHQ